MPSIIKQLRILKSSVQPRNHWRVATKDFLMFHAKTQGSPISNLQFLISILKSPKSNLQSLISNLQFPFSRRLVAIPLSVLLVVVVGIGVSANVALSSLPGDMLYPIKLVTENVRISLTWQGKEKAKLKTEFANRRLDEVKTLAKQPNVSKEHIKVAMNDFKDKVESAKQDLAVVKEQGSAHEVVEAAKALDVQTQEYDKKLTEVKQEFSKEIKAELKDTVSAAQKSVDEAGEQSLQTLVEQADKDGVTTEEVKAIITDRLNAVVIPAKEPGSSKDSLPPTSLQPTTSITEKTLEAKTALDQNDLSKALDAVKETKALTRAAEEKADAAEELIITNSSPTEKEVDTSLGSSTSESNKPNSNIVPSDDHTIVDKNKNEVEPQNADIQQSEISNLKSDLQPTNSLPPTTLQPNNPDAPGAIIIEEK